MKLCDHKYVSLLSPHLRNFKRKGNNIYNFSCPLCGDSQTNKRKARGYLFEKKGSFIYKCHNCGEGKTLNNLIKHVDATLYRQYTIDCMKEDGKYIEPTSEPTIPGTKYDSNVFKDLKKVSELPLEHVARTFVTKRKIPKKYFELLYYAPDYQAFVNSIIPNKLSRQSSPRLVIPYYSFNKEVSGFQGRALDDNPVRYIATVINNDLPRAFGLLDVDFNKKYYVMEGPFDSMFIDNSISTLGSDLVGGIRNLGCNRENAVLIWDNESRNKEILQKMKEAIEQNYSVVIWPSDLIQKDINEIILEGYTSSEVQHIIDRNTKQGLAARLAFNQWKKI